MNAARTIVFFGCVLASLMLASCASTPVGARRDIGTGGTDANAADAFANEASTVDSSLPDMGSNDGAPARDVGTLDAGSALDAFAVDAFASARDAFAPDASGVDAFAIDAFARDAFAVDVGSDVGVPCGAPRVGLFAADDAPAHDTVRTFLMGTGMVASVSIGGPVTASFTPTLADLMAYDAVFVWGSGAWDGTAFGNVLASYVEAGGGVVISVFAQRPDSATGLTGRIATAGYLPYVPSSYLFADVTLGAVPMPAHPIMQGVMRFGGTSVATHDGPIAPGAMLVAALSNGRPLVATLEPAAGRTVLLGFYPVRLWDTATDGSRLMANALRWAACR